jgi:hypothetical protein
LFAFSSFISSPFTAPLKKGNQCVIAGSSVVNASGDRVYYKLTDDFSFDDVPKAPVQLLNILASNTTVKEAG